MNNFLFEKLKGFLSGHFNISPEKVSVTSSLFHDFNSYGMEIMDPQIAT